MYLVRQKRKEGVYYYAVQKKRVNGKVRLVKQIYLGTAKNILDKLTTKSEQTIISKTFGSVALLQRMEKVYDLEKIFNESLAKKRKNNISGRYFLSIIYNRILHPSSKAGIDKWLKTTYLDWVWNTSTSSQKFWNHLEYLDDKAIEEISSKISDKIFELIEDNDFLWDTTNHFTYIQKRKSKFLAKGKSKQGRNDKNLICHGLLVSKNSRMPMSIFPYKYKNDSKIMNEKIDEIKNFIKLHREGSFTLVFDKGNNSKNNIEKLVEGNTDTLKRYGFIGALRKEQATYLLSLPLEKYTLSYTTQKGNLVLVYDAGIKPLYGSEYRIIISYQKESNEKQKRKFDETVKKALGEYKKIKDKRYKTAVSASNALSKILPKKYKKVFGKEISKDGKKWKITLSELQQSRDAYETHFGKNVIFTNKFDMPAVEIVQSYRSLHVVEDQFRALHNSFMIPITPVYEWTDQKINAHVFLCYVALVIVRTLEFLARKKGINVTFSKLLKEAENIRVGLVSDGKNANYCFERMSVQQQEAMNAFQLHEFFTI